jgi:hypothetical protein
MFENQLRNTTFGQLLYIILTTTGIEIGENKHLGNNPWAVIILQKFQDIQGSFSKDFPGLDFFLTNSRTFQDFQGPWGPCLPSQSLLNHYYK